MTSPNHKPPPDPAEPHVQGRGVPAMAVRTGVRDTNLGKNPRTHWGAILGQHLDVSSHERVSMPWPPHQWQAGTRAQGTLRRLALRKAGTSDLFLMTLFTAREISRSQNLSFLIINKQITMRGRRKHIFKPSGFDLIDPGNKPKQNGVVKLERRL